MTPTKPIVSWCSGWRPPAGRVDEHVRRRHHPDRL